MHLNDPHYNENRNRFYGIRKGDLITKKFWGSDKGIVYEVVDYCLMDNNGIFIKEFGVDEEPYKEVAELVTIHTKVEDRTI